MSHDCLELLHNVLHWRILPESQRSGLLSPEQLADRTLPAKILAIGGTDKPHEMSVERYCFRLKNWTVTDKFEWPENKIGGKLLIIGDNVYSIGGWNTDTPRAFNQVEYFIILLIYCYYHYLVSIFFMLWCLLSFNLSIYGLWNSLPWHRWTLEERIITPSLLMIHFT